MQVCRYCSAHIDSQAAEAAAEIQAKVNKAYSDASYIRVVAGTNLVSFGLMFVPIVTVIAKFVFIATFVILPFMLILWQVKYGRIKTPDPDYRKAKRMKNVSLLIWLIMPALWLVLILLLVAAR
jgi:hypothetical protein